MSQPSCDACTDLREYAPEFVMGGVTDNVATSLKNNTGLNPMLTVQHTNCEDLQDVVDCLIGRKMQELEKLDVCDWKDYMAGFAPNLYETLKAMVMNDCGQWAMMCEHLKLLLQIIGGSGAKQHFFTPTAQFRQKWKAASVPPWTEDDVYPILEADIRYGVGCGADSRLAVWRLTLGPKATHYPHTYGMRADDLAVGDILGTINKSALVPNDMPEFVWIGLMRGANQLRAGLLNVNTSIRVMLRGYIVIDGVEFNTDLKAQYGEDVLVAQIIGFTNDLRSGAVWGDFDNLRSYLF